MKFGAYAGASLLVAVVTILHAWHTRVDYYPTVVFLTTNKLAQAALGNWGIVMAIALGKVASKLFLGPLRDIEVEVMYENARYAFSETCLALTVFRGDLTAVTIALFVQLLLIKAFHWLSRARVEHLEQAGAQSLALMARLSSLVFLTVVVDVYMVTYCLGNISVDRASAFVLFAFEYAILSIAAFSTAVHLVLHIVDSRMEGSWHGKATWTMLLEFFSEVFKFSFYVIFFAVMFTLYGVPPLHLVRDIYMSFDQLQRRLQAFYRYRQLANTMDERFPDATEEELEACEHTCIICRDFMDAGKKLPCGHIFHFQCLRLWLQQQQACPTCRANIPTHNTAAAAGAAAERAAAAAAAAAAPAAPAPVQADDPAMPPVGGGAQAAAAPAPAGVRRAPAAAPAPRVPAGADPTGAGRAGAVRDGGGGDPSTFVEMPRAAAGLAMPPAAGGGPGGGGGGRGGGVEARLGVAGPAGLEGFSRSGSEGVGGGGEAAAASGFAGLLRSGGGDERVAEPVLQAVVVVAPTGASVRKNAKPDSPVLRTEPPESLLLLMAAPSSCGSFLVEIAQSIPTGFNDLPTAPPGMDQMMDGTVGARDGLRQRRVGFEGSDR